MNTQNLKRYIVPLFAFFIMLVGARAADYLWEPKFLWEAKETYIRGIYGLQFINNDTQIIYSADGKNYVRDAETGEILIQSEQFDMEMGGFIFSKDKKYLYTYGDATYLGSRNYQALLKFDAQTLKCLDSLPIFRHELHTTFNGKEFSIGSVYSFAIMSDDRILYLCSTRMAGPEYPSYHYCLISFNPQKKDFSWENKDDWKVEYYFVPKENSTSNPPFITKDCKYLIYKSPTNIKVIDLETFKEYWNLPAEHLSSITPDKQYILSCDYPNDAVIFSVKDKKEEYRFDSKLSFNNPFNKSWVYNIMNDPYKVFYGGLGEPYYDVKQNQYKYLFNPELKLQINGPYLTEDKFIFQTASRQLIMYSTNPTSEVKAKDSDSKTEYLQVSDNKLFIPINEILTKEIIIFNADGKLIKQYTAFDSDKENVYLDISFLNKGVYFASVISEKGDRTNYKFMKGE